VDDPRIRTYCDAARALQAGRFDVTIPAEGDDGLAELGVALRDLAQAFESRLKVSHTLSQLAEKVNSGLALEDVLGCVYDSFRSVVPYDRIGVSFLEEDGKVVRARWARTDGGPILLGRGYSAPLRGSSLQSIIATGEARILGDLEAYLAQHPQSESTRLIVEEGMRSSLTCPLLAMGKSVGFIFFSSRHRNAYGEKHRIVFQELALQLSLAIEKSRLYEDLLAANGQLKALRDQLEYRADHDSLTAIWNRGAIVDLLFREVSRSRRESQPLAVALADIDHFKVVNDTHGHAIGDAVLREVADRLRAGLRSAEVVGRYGGEEFMIVLYPCGPHDARVVMERLRGQVASCPIQTPVGPIPTTISMGAAVTDGSLHSDWIVEAADRALYRAKQLGRNRVEVVDSGRGLVGDREGD
jgi:diguanylate cyclase (GGDEF)-like protein